MPSKHHHLDDSDDSENDDITGNTPVNPLLDEDPDAEPNDDPILSSDDEYGDVEPPEDSDNGDDSEDDSTEEETSKKETNASNQTYKSPFESPFDEDQIKILADLNDMEINQLLKQYLASPIAPIPQSDHDKIQHIFTCPLLNPHTKAGLPNYVEQIAKQSGLFDLVLLSRTHKENTRINVHAVLKTCDLFIKQHEGHPLEPKETEALHNGIVVETKDGNLSTIKTFQPDSKQLTDSFKSAIGILYKYLDPSNTNERNILLKTSAIQKSLEHPAPSIHSTDSKPQTAGEISI